MNSGAYIPVYSLIVSNLAKTQGRGAYVIEQEITLQFNNESVSLTEKWWLGSSSQMRLDVTSQQIKNLYLRFIYQKEKKIFKDDKGEIQRISLPLYHLDRPFHLRSTQALTRLFYLWNLAPLQMPERKQGQSTDSFVGLSRRQGVVQYKIGTGITQLWIEQDEFVIREWIWKDGGILKAWDYNIYPRNLFFPSRRKFRWSYLEADIQVKGVNTLVPGKSLFKRTQLVKSNHLPETLSSYARDRIYEFYNQFR